MGFSTPILNEDRVDGEYSSQLKRLFQPEFLNRIDETIIFHSLSMQNIQEIVGILMRDLHVRLQEIGLKAELTEAATEHLANIGYDSAYGARPLRRVLQRSIENELSKGLLLGNL